MSGKPGASTGGPDLAVLARGGMHLRVEKGAGAPWVRLAAQSEAHLYVPWPTRGCHASQWVTNDPWRRSCAGSSVGDFITEVIPSLAHAR